VKISVSPRLLGAILAPLVRLWGRTLRIERVNAATFFDPAVQARRPVIILWHDEIFPLIPSHADVGLACVVSQSQDGELLSQVLERFGFATVRGSSSRGGLRALIAAKRFMMETGLGVIFTVDGPRGPRHQVKPGALFLAEHAGSPILPVRVLMEKSVVFDKAWDKFQLPWLFSRCVITYGDPIELPSTGGDQTELERQCRFLEERMHALGQR
jgi:lysophospholipid acyltransferase (LPLAT)-like uncharacterized protein